MYLSSLPRGTSILIISAFDIQHLRNKNTSQVANIKSVLENILFQADVSDIEGACWHIPSKSNFKNWTKHTIIDLILAAVQGAALPPEVPMQFHSWGPHRAQVDWFPICIQQHFSGIKYYLMALIKF